MILGGRIDHPDRRLIAAQKAETAVLQLRLPPHQSGDALQWIVDQLGEVADKRMVEVQEVELTKLEEPQRNDPQVVVD